MTEIYFEVISKLAKKIRITKTHWKLIVEVKHLEIAKKEELVKQTLQDPDVIRVSQDDSNVYLYYRKYRTYYICVVARHLKDEGFIITIYITDKLKEGEQIWKK